MNDLNELPEEIRSCVITLAKENSNEEIKTQATIEAMMSYLKMQTGTDHPEHIIVPAEIISDKDSLFHFARIYQNALLALRAGALKVHPELTELFQQMPLRG
jgi:hypothetical protein